MTQARKFQLALEAMGIHEDSPNRAEYYTVTNNDSATAITVFTVDHEDGEPAYVDFWFNPDGSFAYMEIEDVRVAAES